ncbi:MAG: hypothetical protein FWE03_06720 [Firmicutes bacterium]|nr:hypothetical protein [Bacillota bacterium]
MKKSNILIGFIKVIFSLALFIAVLGSVYIIVISINPHWELTSNNAALNTIFYTLSNLREMFFIIILPMTIVMILTFLALMMITKKEDEVEFIEIKGKKEIDPEPLFDKIEEFKIKKRVTPKMIMPIAVKLEKLKNSHKYKDNEEFQVRVRNALNWCYEKIGKVEYDVKLGDEVQKTLD